MMNRTLKVSNLRVRYFFSNDSVSRNFICVLISCDSLGFYEQTIALITFEKYLFSKNAVHQRAHAAQ